MYEEIKKILTEIIEDTNQDGGFPEKYCALNRIRNSIIKIRAIIAKEERELNYGNSRSN